MGYKRINNLGKWAVKGKENLNYGKKQSKETCEKRSKNLMEHKVTKKTRKKLSNFRKGKSYEMLLGEEKAKELKKKLSKLREGNQHAKGLKHTEETKKKVGLASKENWRNPEYRDRVLKKSRKTMKKRPNLPEGILKKIIEKNNLPFNYVGNGDIWVGGFNPDFLSKNPKHIIEVFGDYWHNIPNVKKRDKRRLKTYQKYGYQTLIIWDYELTGRHGKELGEKEIIKKIKRFIK